MDPWLFVGTVLGGGFGGAAVFTAAVATVSVSQNIFTDEKERLSADQWGELWRTKKEWLSSVVTQKCTSSTSEILSEFTNILIFSGYPIKGCHPSITTAYRRIGTEYTQMCLTFIPFEYGSSWKRSYNNIPRKKLTNHTLLPAVEGLRKLAEMAENMPSTETKWHSDLAEFAHNYASHLLLNYRELKEDKFEAEDYWEETVGRQKTLNAKMEILLLPKDKIVDASMRRGLEKAIVTARQIEAAKDGETLSLEALTIEEQEMIQTFRSKKETLALPAQITGEAFIEKMVASAEVQTASTFSMPQVVIEIADENRSIASSSLGRILEQEEDACQASLVKQLRADNLYLRQKSEEFQ